MPRYLPPTPPRHPYGDDWDEDPVHSPSTAEAITVESEERYVLAELLGPDGEVISQLLDRPEVSEYGFCREKEVTQWRRQ